MTRKTGIDEEPRRIVLVGTRKGDQSKDWPGCYAGLWMGSNVANVEVLPVPIPDSQW